MDRLRDQATDKEEPAAEEQPTAEEPTSAIPEGLDRSV